MIPKSLPLGLDPMGRNRFSEKIMLKQRNLNFDPIQSNWIKV